MDNQINNGQLIPRTPQCGDFYMVNLFPGCFLVVQWLSVDSVLIYFLGKDIAKPSDSSSPLLPPSEISKILSGFGVTLPLEDMLQRDEIEDCKGVIGIGGNTIYF